VGRSDERVVRGWARGEGQGCGTRTVGLSLLENVPEKKKRDRKSRVKKE